jgi:hypothetical protein
MMNWKSVRVACGVVVLGLVVAASSHVWAFGHENRLTFSRAVSLPGVVLPAGTYSFDVMDSYSTLDVIEVRNTDGTKLFYRGLTNPIERPRNLPRTAMITFGEAPANEPPPITTWYELGSLTGHKFLYQ